MIDKNWKQKRIALQQKRFEEKIRNIVTCDDFLLRCHIANELVFMFDEICHSNLWLYKNILIYNKHLFNLKKLKKNGKK